MDPSKLVDWIKLTPRYLFALCLAGGVLLFAKASWLAPLGLDAFVGKYRFWIGLVFLVGLSLLLAHVLAHAMRKGLDWWTEFRGVHQGRKRLHQLTEEERRILASYIEGKTRTQMLRISDGVVSGLVSQRIIYMSANLGSGHDPYFAHNIQPWAWEYLNEHPELVLRASNTSVRRGGAI